MIAGSYLVALLVAAIVFVIVGTARLKLHPFLVLLLTAYGFGLLAGLSPEAVIEAITGGFGGTIGYIGIVIAAGTIIGALLERSGAALVMARTIMRGVGRARSVLAMSITGAVVSIPVFCDSGFVILSPLCRSLSAETRQSMASYAVALSMGLYATHVFVPPTPGPIAAAGELGASIGAVIVLGILVTIPVMLATYVFALYMGRRIDLDPAALSEASQEADMQEADRQDMPAWKAFTPILVPILLIALQSIAELPNRPFGEGALFSLTSFIGDPNTALLLGVFLAFVLVPLRGADLYTDLVGQGLRQAGVIILITGAGGALGRVLQATPLGTYLGESLGGLGLGALSIFLPFLVASALKTALGSSTVAIITTASIMVPLLPTLGLGSDFGPVLTTLAIGAGAMTISHANDSYFWVVSQFSGMNTTQAYKLQTGGSAVAGLTGIITVFAMSLFLL